MVMCLFRINKISHGHDLGIEKKKYILAAKALSVYQWMKSISHDRTVSCISLLLQKALMIDLTIKRALSPLP